MINIETENEINGNKIWDEKNKQKDLKYKTNKYTYYFQQYEKIKPFGENIYTSEINKGKAEMEQINLLENMVKFNNKSRPRSKIVRKKTETYESAYAPDEGPELTLNAFKVKHLQ